MKLIVANPPRSARVRRRRRRRARRNPGVSSVKKSSSGRRRRFGGLGSIKSATAYLNKGTIKSAAIGAAATLAVPMLLSKVGVLKKIKSPIAKVAVNVGAMIAVAALSKKYVGDDASKAIALAGLGAGVLALYNQLIAKKGAGAMAGYDDFAVLGDDDLGDYNVDGDVAGYLEGDDDLGDDDLGDDELGDDDLGDDDLGDDELGDDVEIGEYETV